MHVHIELACQYCGQNANKPWPGKHTYVCLLNSQIIELWAEDSHTTRFPSGSWVKTLNTRMVYLLPVESEPVPVGACAGNPQDISKLESQADERWGTCAMSTALPLSVYQSPLSNCWTTHRLTRSHDNNTTKAFFWHISNILIGLIKLCNDNTFTFFYNTLCLSNLWIFAIQSPSVDMGVLFYFDVSRCPTNGSHYALSAVRCTAAL